MEIEMLIKEVQELRDTKDDGADAVKLVQALESEKLGASRAVLQNQQLKEQLTEMENAFVTLVSYTMYINMSLFFTIIVFYLEKKFVVFIYL